MPFVYVHRKGFAMERKYFFLIVEDDDACYKLTVKRLRRWGVKVPIFRSTNGIEAYKFVCNYVESGMAEFVGCIMLLDINMPGLNGIELMQRLADCQLSDFVITIIHSTTACPKTVRQTLSLGAVDYIVKLIEIEKLSDALKNAGIKFELLTVPEKLSCLGLCFNKHAMQALSA